MKYFSPLFVFNLILPNLAIANEAVAAPKMDIITLAWLFRIAERGVLAVIIVFLSLAIIIVFRRSMQKIDFSIERNGSVSSANIMLATPIFVLLILVGYAYVTFSFPLETKNSPGAQVGEESLPNGRYMGGTRLSEGNELQISKAVSSVVFLVKSGLIKTDRPAFEKELAEAIERLEELRGDYVIRHKGVDALRLWKAEGEVFQTTPGLLNETQRKTLGEVAPWFSRIEGY